MYIHTYVYIHTYMHVYIHPTYIQQHQSTPNEHEPSLLVDEDILSVLSSMGFTRNSIMRALRATGHHSLTDLDSPESVRVIEWLTENHDGDPQEGDSTGDE